MYAIRSYYVKEGDDIPAGSTVLKVMHTPGHSPGGICLAIDSIVFTGDTVFAGSVGRTDFPGGNIEALKVSVITSYSIHYTKLYEPRCSRKN